MSLLQIRDIFKHQVFTGKKGLLRGGDLYVIVASEQVTCIHSRRHWPSQSGSIHVRPSIPGETLLISKLVYVSERWTVTKVGTESFSLWLTTALFVPCLQTYCFPMMGGPRVKYRRFPHHILLWNGALKITATGIDKMICHKCFLLEVFWENSATLF